MLAEVVVAGDGLSAEVAHEAAAAARHPVAALRFDQARPALDALPHPSCRHALLAAPQRQSLENVIGEDRFWDFHTDINTHTVFNRDIFCKLTAGLACDIKDNFRSVLGLKNTCWIQNDM